MEIGYFREFVILAETLNYWEASERLFIGQSSLSKHIKTLEKQLGAPLFDRTSRRVSLTEFGKLMLPYARSAARLQFEYESAAHSYLQSDGGELCIASIPALAHYSITDILVRYQMDFPNVQLNVQEADTLVAYNWLLRHKCELAFVRDSTPRPGTGTFANHTAGPEPSPDQRARLGRIPYRQDRLVAVLPSGHPLSGKTELKLADLADEYFVMIKPGTLPYMLCMQACQQAGFTPKLLFTSHHLDALLDMVRKGSCVALLFEGHVGLQQKSKDQAPPYTAVPVTPAIPTTIYLAYLKEGQLSPAALHFIDYCQLALAGKPLSR